MNKTFSAAMSAALLTLTAGASAQTPLSHTFQKGADTFVTTFDKWGNSSVTWATTAGANSSPVPLASRRYVGDHEYTDEQNQRRVTRKFDYQCDGEVNKLGSKIATRLFANNKNPVDSVKPGLNTKTWYFFFANRGDIFPMSGRFSQHYGLASDADAQKLATFARNNNVRYMIGYGFGLPEGKDSPLQENILIEKTFRLMQKLKSAGVQKVVAEGHPSLIAKYNAYALERLPKGALLISGFYSEDEPWGGLTEGDPATDGKTTRRMVSPYTGQMLVDQQDRFFDFVVNTCYANRIAVANGLQTTKYIGGFGEEGNREAQAKFYAENFDEIYIHDYTKQLGQAPSYSLPFTLDSIYSSKNDRYKILNEAVKLRSDYSRTLQPLPVSPIFFVGWGEKFNAGLYGYLKYNSLDSVYANWSQLYKKQISAYPKYFDALKLVQPVWLGDEVYGDPLNSLTSNITLNPSKSTVVEVGETVLLSVRSKAPTDKKSVAWIFNGQPITASNWYTPGTYLYGDGVNNPALQDSLLLRLIPQSASGNYYAVVSDSNGLDDHNSFASSTGTVLVKKHTTEAEKVDSLHELVHQVMYRVRDLCLADVNGCAKVPPDQYGNTPVTSTTYYYGGYSIRTLNGGFPSVEPGAPRGNHDLVFAMNIAHNLTDSRTLWTQRYSADGNSVIYSLRPGCSVTYTQAFNLGAPVLTYDKSSCSTTLSSLHQLDNLEDMVIAGRDAGRQDCVARERCVGGSTQFNFPTGPRRFLFGYPDAGINTRADIGAWVKTSGVTVANSGRSTLFKVTSARDSNICYVSYQQPTGRNKVPTVTSVRSGCL